MTVVTDSACDLTPEIVRAHGIHVTPLALVDGDDTYRDGIDITGEQFHDRLRSGGELPTTSQPPPADFSRRSLEPRRRENPSWECSRSSALSGTFGSAEVAAARFEAVPIHLADSLGASLLEGMLVLKAAELAELGRDPESIVEEIRRVRAQSGILFTVGSLDRLIASGRVSRGHAVVGRLLRIQPILGLHYDGVRAFGKAIGRTRTRRRLMQILRSQIPLGAERLRFGIVHVGFPEMVPEISRELQDEYGEDSEILAAPATPVIATHTGIGTWGVAYLVED